MEQQQDDIDPSDAGVDGDGALTEDEEPLIKRHFLLLLALALGVAGVAGVGVTYAQYDRVGETIQAIPYVGQIAQNPGTVPYADQIAGMLPFVGGDSGGDTESKKVGALSKLEGLVVNPAGSRGNRYLAISVVFEMEAPKVKKEMEKKKVIIKDAVLRLLSERTVEELSDPERRDNLKKALREEANGILSKGEVDRLYFTEFVLQ
ncbi:flagellar basal body-associated FliL family protein [Salinibacter ruber]|jgi:flagellar FliL protein|uniref:Flagellar protein FliL n=1 Tax=Salinibacter ruber TaxID=146919 RepID=A0A9X2V2T5_9BACT|nr:flagellar basal body-associated FliL family protein [Salinibacter ruber]MCS3663879.1 flagellar FliL protein [Salinibacter ruber]MCS3705571.1 flagellar FliL protein [Salinibacter ruber]MCS4057447.1 flagellar FliL protein [Salinibacter ruber]MCS4059802.1 flagellar FliL protein [Salinibacter ruber]MCS4086626.1 flagellar FliL protein [Salinibacter ruber]